MCVLPRWCSRCSAQQIEIIFFFLFVVLRRTFHLISFFGLACRRRRRHSYPISPVHKISQPKIKYTNKSLFGFSISNKSIHVRDSFHHNVIVDVSSSLLIHLPSSSFCSSSVCQWSERENHSINLTISNVKFTNSEAMIYVSFRLLYLSYLSFRGRLFMLRRVQCMRS